MYRFFLVLVLASNVGGAQAAMPRRATKSDPATLLTNLMSKDPERVSSALQDADLTLLRDAVDASLTAVNLDSDADLERILRVRSLGSYGVAVFKQESGVWWVLGSFVCGGPRNRMQDPFIELKPLISPGTSDIIVHSGGSQGTGVGAAQFTVYRVFKGQLYQVLDIVEYAYNWTSDEKTQIHFRDRSIIVRRTRKSRNQETTSSEMYRWDAGRFMFARTWGPP